jgi:HK97 family phage prohead protease
MTSAAIQHERRAALTEVRAKGRRYNTEARIGSFVETIKPGAFAGSLSRDVLALVDHDPSRVLGRTKSGTLRLSEDTRGLVFDLDLPDTQAARDVLALAERGDLGGCSFGFTCPAGGDHWNGDRRELRNVTLHEISIVQSWPAYDGTVVNARSVLLRRPVGLALARLYLKTLEG